MSNRKEPIDLILAKGNKAKLSKKEIEKRKKEELDVASDKIVAPSYLTKNLKEEFERIANELNDVGIITNLDVDALARYITSEYNYQKVSKYVNRTGVMNDDYYDLVLLQEKWFKMVRQSAGDLGLTISSRCKIVIPKVEEEKEDVVGKKFKHV